ncbi:unnamed protein product [Cochlearia groenlandica]
MDGRGGCCIARYGGYNGRYGLSKADRIMLRFRPIAPKPPTDGGSSGSSVTTTGKYGSTTTTGGAVSDLSGISKRGKRKCNKESSGGNSRRKRSQKNSDGGEATISTAAITLSLLPEMPEKRVFPDLNVSPVENKKRNGPLWLSFGGGDDGGRMQTPYINTADISRKTVVVSSCVTVERVTDAWINGYGLGNTDDERKMNLMRDTCPGFISDGVGRVTWTNEAVKLQYTCQDRERGSVTVPCDVWRMDGGGFAWRLDVKAALCL